MCLIILANDVQSLNYKDLEIAYKRNSHGFGVMYLDNKDNFISDKFVPKNFNEVKNFLNLHRTRTKAAIAMHFRFTTEGKTNKKNCHPFISYQDDKRTIGFMHNGARLPIPLVHKNCSDTWHFNEHYLKQVFKNNPNIILQKNYIEELEDHIGNDKLLFLDSKTKKFIIVNEKVGNYRGANWFSNDYWNDQVFKFSKPKIQYNNYNNYFDDLDNQYTNLDYYNVPTNEELCNMTEIEIHNFIDECIETDNVFPIVDIIQDYKKYIAS